jgi:hypothetical protein
VYSYVTTHKRQVMMFIFFPRYYQQSFWKSRSQRSKPTRQSVGCWNFEQLIDNRQLVIIHFWASSFPLIKREKRAWSQGRYHLSDNVNANRLRSSVLYTSPPFPPLIDGDKWKKMDSVNCCIQTIRGWPQVTSVHLWNRNNAAQKFEIKFCRVFQKDFHQSERNFFLMCYDGPEFPAKSKRWWVLYKYHAQGTRWFLGRRVNKAIDINIYLWRIGHPTQSTIPVGECCGHVNSEFSEFSE